MCIRDRPKDADLTSVAEAIKATAFKITRAGELMADVYKRQVVGRARLLAQPLGEARGERGQVLGRELRVGLGGAAARQLVERGAALQGLSLIHISLCTSTAHTSATTLMTRRAVCDTRPLSAATWAQR